MAEKKSVGFSKREEEARRDREKRAKTTRVAVLITAVVAVLFVGALIVNSSWLRRTAPAVSVEGVSFSPVEYHYYYTEAVMNYNNFITSYLGDSAADMLPDFSASLDSQVFDTSTGQTWADYFDDMTRSNLIDLASVYAEAKAEGFALTDEQEKAVGDELEEIRAQLAESGKTLADYLAIYGPGMTESVFREITELQHYADAYSQVKWDGFTYTDDALKTYYSENRDTLDRYTYRAFLVSAETLAEEDFETTEAFDEAKAAALTAAKEKADGYAALIEAGEILAPDPAPEDPDAEDADTADTDAPDPDAEDGLTPEPTPEDAFIAAARDYDAATYADASSTLKTVAGDALPAASDWFYASERAAGDLTVTPNAEESPTGYYVIYFLDRYDNAYTTVNVRQLVVTPETVDYTQYTDAEGSIDTEAFAAETERVQADAKALADELYALWDAASLTEEKLTELTDGAESDLVTGGELKNLEKGRSGVEASIEEWLYAPERKPGDTKLTQSESGAWYLLYFQGTGLTYADSLSDTALRNADYTAWRDAYAANTVEYHWAYKLRYSSLYVAL